MEKYGGNLKPRARSAPGKPRPKLKRAAPPVPPNSAAAQARALTRPQPKRGSPLTPLATPRALARAKLPVQKPAKHHSVAQIASAVSGLNTLRTVGGAALATGEEFVSHPVRSTEKGAGTVKDIVKGVGGAAIGLPVYAVEHPLKTLSGEGATHIAKRMVSGEADAISKKYGPLWRGEKGGLKHLKKVVHEEGPLPTALDVATAVAPLSSGLGKAARATADAGAGGRVVNAVAHASRERPKLKVNPVTSGVAQKVRPSIIGTANTATTDAARRVAQKVAVKRAARPGAKPLRGDRKLLGPDEVAPVTRLGANRKLRLSTATNQTRRHAAANYRVREHVTGSRGETLRTVHAATPKELQPAVNVALRLGIRDSAGARAAIKTRIAKIQEDRAAALAKSGKLGKVDAKAEAARHAVDNGELDLLAQLHAHPEVFDHPTVRGAIEARARISRVPGEREGLADSRAAHGRADNLAHGLGVKKADQLNEEARAAHAADVERAKGAVAAKRAEVIKLQQAVARDRLVTKEAAIGKGMGGKVSVADSATLKSISRHEAKLARQRKIRHGKTRDIADFHDTMTHVGHTLDTAPSSVVDDLKNWSHGVIVGQANKLRDVEATHAAFEPLRQKLKAKYGDTLLMHRGVRPYAADDGRPHTSWTLNKAMARDYAGDNGKVISRQVPIDDIVAALGDSKKFGASESFNEFIVRRGNDLVSPKRGGKLLRVAGHGESLVRNARGLDVAKQELRGARAQAKLVRSTKPPVLSETGQGLEARVIAANKELHPNLVGPEHVPAGFEKGTLPDINRPRGDASANPAAKKSKGILDRLGRSEADHKLIEQQAIGLFKRGAEREYENKLIEQHGRIFPDEHSMAAWADKHKLNINNDKRTGPVGDIVSYTPSNGLIRKDLAAPTKGSGDLVDHGAYHKTDAVVALPRAVAEELKALDSLATRTPNAITDKVRAAMHYSQAVLLGGSLSWFQFQRVNDLIAAGVGGSLIHTRALNKAMKSLDPASREQVHIFSGGSISSAELRPDAIQQVGRMKQILDTNPVYQKALKSRTPAGALLRVNDGNNPLTGLLRADQAITGGVRERQFIHNLSKVAKKMDPEVAKVNSGLSRIADAFKTGDMAAVDRLLKDPAQQHLVEEAAQSLYKIHGDWHNFTAAERKLGPFTAFYGFLRYATRMALFTLPLGHPTMSLLLAQLGQMDAADVKKIIGPDQPWGLGALYNDDGTVAADFTRANPLTSPLFNLDKPEDVVGLATPLASIAASYIAGQPIGLSNSAEGYLKQFVVKGDPQNHNIGGFIGKERLRIALRQVLGLAAPMREWDKFDGAQQSDDSLPWSRRHLVGINPADRLKIATKNRTNDGGLKGLLHRELPLLEPGSAKNLKTQGAAIAASKKKAADAQELSDAKRQSALHGIGQLDLQLQDLDSQLQKQQGDDPFAELDRQLKLLDAKTGG